VGQLKHRQGEADSLFSDWLKDKDPFLRAFTAEALSARPASEGLVNSLIKLLGDPELGVRVRAVEALGAWKADQAVPGLQGLLKDSSEVLRFKAVQALGAIGAKSSKEALRYVAANDSKPEVKAEAAKALKQLAR
jgi:HEAT repeat protein